MTGVSVVSDDLPMHQRTLACTGPGNRRELTKCIECTMTLPL